MKNERLEKILELVTHYDIDTQELLIEKLREEGYSVTQTTVSRDIRQLGLVKGVGANGVYKYIIQNAKKPTQSFTGASVITDSVESIEDAHNIIVVKTHSGMANPVAICIESMSIPHLLGSVAGDDTIVIVIKHEMYAKDVVRFLKSTFKV